MNANARLVSCAPKSCQITPLLRELHWLPVCYTIEYKIILLTFKVLHGMAPYYLRHLISVLPPSRYNLRRNDDFAALLTFPKIRTKKTLADRSFSCAAPRLWNLLPTTIVSRGEWLGKPANFKGQGYCSILQRSRDRLRAKVFSR